MNENRGLCQLLPKEVQSIVRSGIAITNVAQCVEELVLNSVDARATKIFVDVNLDNFNVRVEDDGIGVGKGDLEAVGIR
jgi:DNA mismatch repair protein MLH3